MAATTAWRAWTAAWKDTGRGLADPELVDCQIVSKLKEDGAKNAKHRHRTANPILLTEENALLATIDRALASSGNAQVIGRNGELPLRHFFNRYLPFTLRAATGHFITPRGQRSAQIDLMILDARYPLLAENQDGTVLAMLHSVIATYEVKTRMTTRDLARGWANARKIMRLAGEIRSYGYGYRGGWSAVRTDAIAYRLAQRLETTDRTYVKEATPTEAGFDVNILRLPPQDQAPGGNLGADLHMEPIGKGPDSYLPTCRLSQTMLSDVYFRLVQDAYYTLAHRDWSFGHIGQHFNEYMAWATLPWEDYAAMRRVQPTQRPTRPEAP